MTITLAASSTSTMATPVLMAVKEFTDQNDGVEWANEQAWRWIRKMNNVVAASGGLGKFVIEGYTNLTDDGSDVPMRFFNSLSDELLITANGGEEIFIVAVDEETLELLAETKALLTPVLLTADEISTLREKLTWLLHEGDGVDIWLAPGQNLVDNEECFLDADEEAHTHLESFLKKLDATN